MLTKSYTQSFVAGLDPATNEKIEAGSDAGRLLGRSGLKLWCHLAHETE
jgi:hypothetical protein